MQNTCVRSHLDVCVPLLSSVQCSQTEGRLAEVRLVILNSLFTRFFHLSAINRQRVRLTPLPTSGRGGRTKLILHFLTLDNMLKKTTQDVIIVH